MGVQYIILRARFVGNFTWLATRKIISFVKTATWQHCDGMSTVLSSTPKGTGDFATVELTVGEVYQGKSADQTTILTHSTLYELLTNVSNNPHHITLASQWVVWNTVKMQKYCISNRHYQSVIRVGLWIGCIIY